MTDYVRVLLTCLGGRYSLCTVMAFRESSDPIIDIVGVDMTDDAVAKSFVKSFYTVPRGSDDTYIPKLLRICKDEGVDIVIPCADEEVVAISREKQLFENEGIICAVDNYETIELINDKWELYSALTKKGIPMPKFQAVGNVSEVRGITEQFGYPKKKVVIKPRRARGSRGLWILGEDGESTSFDEFMNYCKAHQIDEMESIAMEYLPGPAYDVDVVSCNGEPACIVPRLRVYKNKLSNFSEGHRFEKNLELIHLTEKISRSLRLNWGFDFDCGSFADGTPGIYEVNPRLSGSVAAGMGAGVNVPLILVRLIKGLEIPQLKIDYGVTMFPFHSMAFIGRDGRGVL